MMFDEDNTEETKQPDPVIDDKNIGDDGTRIGEGHDPIEDNVT